MQKGRPIYFYVANLGSEIQRMLVWKKKGDVEAMQNAYKRALDIIKTIKNFENPGANEEMRILQNFLEDFISKNDESVDRDQISAYFNPFALRTLSNLKNSD